MEPHIHILTNECDDTITQRRKMFIIIQNCNF